MENKKKRNLLASFIIFTLLIILTFNILIDEQEVPEILRIFKSAKIEFVIIRNF